ncbi:hypothetical protein [Candidatus Nitrosocosmicus arcticus]|uniref:hypothetical protein n=1 Tax=Candidatus Nitrosocosmicus arcticus TaxID=2035267 RepID=UPI0011A0E95B|nr:hypothetical protein [Candidatus Nitrosocosmicus arcticus]
MHIANKISPILMVFLLISFSTIYGSKSTPSYGQISLVPDNSLIAQTTDCITSMMTSALIGINSDCTDNLNKINSTYPDKAPDSSSTSVSSSDKAPDSSSTSVSSSDKAPDSSSTSVSSSSISNPYNLSKNNPFYHEFQSKNTVDGDVSTPTFTSDSSNTANGNYMDTFQSPPQDNPSTFLKSPPQDNPSTFLKSPPQDNPSTLSELQQQNMNRPISNPYSFQSFHTSVNKNIYTTPTSSELGESLDGKNKHSKEIAACFDRAFSIDNYLADSEIIECAEDRDSYSQNSLHNYALSDNIKNNDNDNDGKTDNKHSKEIAACFDRAFSIDNYLADSEIIECAEDRDSFK